jgi:hypothetical protein
VAADRAPGRQMRYWQHWTDIQQVGFTVIARGSGLITIRASDVAGDPRTIATTTIDGGALWLEASTGAAELVLESAYWSVPQREKVRLTAVVMCTYNRADDCLRTLDTLSRDSTALAVVDKVYVVDQENESNPAEVLPIRNTSLATSCVISGKRTSAAPAASRAGSTRSWKPVRLIISTLC